MLLRILLIDSVCQRRLLSFIQSTEPIGLEERRLEHEWQHIFES